VAASIEGAWFMAHDVAEEDAWGAVAEAVREREGRLDVLVNNAGIGTGMPVMEMSLAAWNRQVGINLTGVFLGTRACVPLMRAGGRGGSIVNISSVAGLEGSAGLAGYCATKGGVRLFTKACAKEFAPDRIRVNSVHPGIIDTPIWGKIDAGMENTDQYRQHEGANALSADMIAQVGAPMGVAGRPEDIAAGIAFLASADSAYMTGSELVIDGGWTA
jgi:NAD(P)-dependent dehydrogenase (short-subunit alcohol dehydrogenase family)